MNAKNRDKKAKVRREKYAHEDRFKSEIGIFNRLSSKRLSSFVLTAILVISVFAILAFAGTAAAEVINVNTTGFTNSTGFHPCSSPIQCAINNATAGDTIIVAAGTYSAATNGETFPVTVNKANLTIRGTGTATIDAGAAGTNVVDITADNVTINGFTIQNAGGAATVVGINMDDRTGCNISNVVIKNITGTTYGWGIHGYNMNSNTFSDITISDIRETGAAANHGAWGIWLGNADGNIFTNVNISNITADSDAQGIMLYVGCDNNRFTNTTITNLKTMTMGYYPVGISIYGATPSNNNIFTDTTISDIPLGAADWAAGIQDRGGNTGNIYINTNISNIQSTAIAYGVAVAGGSSVTFNGGNIQNITGGGATTNVRGFSIWEANSAADIKGMTISNAANGILIRSSSNASLSAVHYNNIVGNAEYGIQNQDTAHTLDATNNWWGANDGPSDGAGVTDPVSGEPADGSGDKVSANVHFDPWLGAEL